MVIYLSKRLLLGGLFLSMFMGFLPETLFAQVRTTFRVLAISEEDGNPIIGANVILYRSSGDMYRAGATDADGLFEFRNINPCTYDLVIS